MLRHYKIRYGNWVMVDGEPRQIKEMGCFLTGEDTTTTSDMSEPNGVSFIDGDDVIYRWFRLHDVPLTPEWMRRFGFEENADGEDNVWIHPDIPSLVFTHKKIYDLFESSLTDGQNFMQLTSVKSVRHLQNLLSEVTDKEIFAKKLK